VLGVPAVQCVSLGSVAGVLCDLPHVHPAADAASSLSACVPFQDCLSDCAAAGNRFETADLIVAEPGALAQSCLLDAAPLASTRSRKTGIFKGLKIAILCGGPNAREDSLFHLLQSAGICVEAWDTANGPNGDLTDDAIWDPLEARIRMREFVGIFASPPCSSFSRLRNKSGGPPPLRGVDGRSRYGLPHLDPKQKEAVRTSNIISVRVASALQLIAQQGGLFIYETPAVRKGEVSMLRLDEFVALLSLPGVVHTIGIQCTFGGKSAKATSWVTCNVQFQDMPSVCPHPMVRWYSDTNGVVVMSRHCPTHGMETFSRHPPTLNTTDVAIPLVVPPASSGGRFISSALSAYPPLLNRYIVAKLVLA
jgi:hypothetical protein